MRPARAFWLLALVAATGLLAVGAWTARSALRQLSLERRDAATAAARLDALRAAMPEVARREAYSRLAARATQQAASMGFDPATWAERRITRASGPISRADASVLLSQIDAGGGTRFFAADGFELSVLSRNAGLFTPPAFDDTGLTMAVNGALHFPLSAPR